MNIQLDNEIVFNIILGELNKRSIKFNEEVLKNYVDFKISLAKRSITPIGIPAKDKTEIKRATLLNWTNTFIYKYCYK